MESELSGSERVGWALGFRWRASELEHYLRPDGELLRYWHRQKLESLQAGLERQLTIRTTNGDVETRPFSGTECWTFTVGQGQNRSASPTKRVKRQPSNEAGS
jgi:hypothetical protein